MSERHTINGLLQEFGRTIGIPDLDLDDEGYCILVIDEKLVINMEFDQLGQQLLIYSLVGETSGDAARVHEQMLRSNYLGRDTGGATLGLRPEDGGVVLSQWVAVPGLDLPRFTAILETFVNQVDDWTRRLPELGATRDTESPPVEFPLIRG